jgi:hypothetical protein
MNDRFSNRGQMLDALSGTASCGFIIGAMAIGLAAARLVSQIGSGLSDERSGYGQAPRRCEPGAKQAPAERGSRGPAEPWNHLQAAGAALKRRLNYSLILLYTNRAPSSPSAMDRLSGAV